MTYYPSFERPDPATTAPWREYRRWQAARRRRRWTAAALALAVLAAGGAALWPSELRHPADDPAAALAGFDAPPRGATVAIGPSHNLAPSEEDRAAITALMGSSAPATPPIPDEISLVPATDPPPVPAVAATPPGPPAAIPSAAPAPSADAPPMPNAKPTPAPSSGPSIQLASFRSEAKAQSALERLSREQKDVLGDLPMHVQRAELRDGRVVFRVQAGALDGAAEARRICAELKRRRLDCQFLR